MPPPHRPSRSSPISVGHLRAFEAVAKHLNFRVAAEELFLTQSAVSRQVQALEDEVGSALFLRHTRSVELTSSGALLLRATGAALVRIDSAVRQIRQNAGRRSVTISTWASFASMWLIPRLEAFQREYPDIDIRIDASDTPVDLSTADVDLALRYAKPRSMPSDAVRLFGEQITPVASPWLLREHPVSSAQDLAGITLIEADDTHHQEWLGWQRWLEQYTTPAAPDKAEPPKADTKADARPRERLTPQRWLYFNYVNQIVQAALTGQGVALARLPLVAESLASGDLVEPLPDKRMDSPFAYWLLLAPHSTTRTEVKAFCDWLLRQAQRTRDATEGGPPPPSRAHACGQRAPPTPRS